MITASVIKELRWRHQTRLPRSSKEHVKLTDRSVWFLPTLQNVLPRQLSLIICKLFIRSHLHFGRSSYNQAFKKLFHHNFEMIQCNTTRAITVPIESMSKEEYFTWIWVVKPFNEEDGKGDLHFYLSYTDINANVIFLTYYPVGTGTVN